MSDVKWIKIVVNIFDDEKIKFIETMPNGDAIIVIWFRLLCLAGKSNSFGLLMFTNKIPYTEEMLASIFNRDIKQIQMALGVFEQLEMVVIEDNKIAITNWDKHQNIDGMEKIREQNRLRKQRQREREQQKQLENNMSRDMSRDVTQQNKKEEIDIEEEIDIDKDIDKEKNVCTEHCVQSAKEPIEPPAIQLPLNDKSLYDITKIMIDEYTELYPNVDIMQELKKMKGWLNANPTRRKTKRGILRFINSWLSKEQDKPHYNQPALHNVDVEEEKEEETKKTMMSDEELKLLLDQVKDGVF